MKARVKSIEGATFVGESGSGPAVVLDGSPEAGGRNLGIRPMESLLIGLGACTALDAWSAARPPVGRRLCGPPKRTPWDSSEASKRSRVSPHDGSLWPRTSVSRCSG